MLACKSVQLIHISRKSDVPQLMNSNQSVLSECFYCMQYADIYDCQI